MLLQLLFLSAVLAPTHYILNKFDETARTSEVCS